MEPQGGRDCCQRKQQRESSQDLDCHGYSVNSKERYEANQAALVSDQRELMFALAVEDAAPDRGASRGRTWEVLAWQKGTPLGSFPVILRR